MTATATEAETLEALDFAPRCRMNSSHPHEPVCEQPAKVLIRGHDSECGEILDTLSCYEHVGLFEEAMYEGWWCWCTGHRSHPCEYTELVYL